MSESDSNSTLPRYHEITTCTESYFAREGDSPLGMGWPNAPDAVRRYQVMLDVIREEPGTQVSLLDFGCGVGHLYDFICDQQRSRDTAAHTIDYHGVDLSRQFIDVARSRNANTDFRQIDVLLHPEQLSTYDYAVINGVFTSKCSMSFDEMLTFVKDVLILLFSQVRCGIAFNAMSKHVDWERDDLFHLPFETIAAFLTEHLSRHFVFRNDYGLYEYTTYVYQRPRL